MDSKRKTPDFHHAQKEAVKYQDIGTYFLKKTGEKEHFSGKDAGKKLPYYEGKKFKQYKERKPLPNKLKKRSSVKSR